MVMSPEVIEAIGCYIVIPICVAGVACFFTYCATRE
jgi:hypothetical protein